VLAAIVINLDPILLQLGPIAIRWYGLMYVVGIVVGIQVGLPYVRSRGISEDQVWNVIGPCIIAGLIGGRLYYVVQQPLGPYLAQPWRIIATWEGGMAFYGAIIGVVVALVLMSWREKISFWTIFDGAVILAAVGQFFGRIGNVINGDILGAPTTLPWGFIYVHPNSFAASHTIAYQPAAIYEMIGNLIIVGILFFLRYRVKRSGILAAVYVICYAVSQFILFYFRDTEPTVGLGLKQAQLTSIVALVVGLVILAYRLRSTPTDSTPATVPPPSTAVADSA